MSTTEIPTETPTQPPSDNIDRVAAQQYEKLRGENHQPHIHPSAFFPRSAGPVRVSIETSSHIFRP